VTDEVDDPERAQAAAAETALRQALARQGFDRADDHGGLTTRGHRSTDASVWLTLGGRLSGASAARLTAILNAAPPTGSDRLAAWQAGERVSLPGQPEVPPRGSIVLDITQIDRPGRVEDWDGQDLLTLRPPAGAGEPWTAALGDVRGDSAHVDTRLLDR